MCVSTKPTDEYSDEEAERRATEALRRTLTTPYKPQKEMVGKIGKSSTRQRKPREQPKEP